MQDLGLIASKVAGVLLVMVAGGIARRLGWLSSLSDQSLAVMTSNVLLPALFIDRIVGSPVITQDSGAWIAPFVGFGCTTVGFLLAWGVISYLGPLFGITDSRVHRTFALTAGVCNYGYIPLPLAEQFFPDAVVPLMVHNVGVDLSLWTVGIMIISGGTGSGWRRAIASPPLWAVIFAMAIQKSGLGSFMPAPIMQMAHSLGQCAIPVGLLLGGAIIVDYWNDIRWKQSIPTVGLAIAVRIVVLPILFLALAKLWSWPMQLDVVLMLQASMPAATFPIVLARLYAGDLPTALRVVVGTSILGILTIPIWIVIGKQFLGVH